MDVWYHPFHRINPGAILLREYQSFQLIANIRWEGDEGDEGDEGHGQYLVIEWILLPTVDIMRASLHAAPGLEEQRQMDVATRP